MFYCYKNWSDESLMQVKDDNDLCQSRSNVVKNVLLLPTLARRISKQVKDDDDIYKGQRSTEVKFCKLCYGYHIWSEEPLKQG